MATIKTYPTTRSNNGSLIPLTTGDVKNVEPSSVKRWGLISFKGDSRGFLLADLGDEIRTVPQSEQGPEAAKLVAKARKKFRGRRPDLYRWEAAS